MGACGWQLGTIGWLLSWDKHVVASLFLFDDYFYLNSAKLQIHKFRYVGKIGGLIFTQWRHRQVKFNFSRDSIFRKLHTILLSEKQPFLQYAHFLIMLRGLQHGLKLSTNLIIRSLSLIAEMQFNFNDELQTSILSKASSIKVEQSVNRKKRNTGACLCLVG